MPAIAGFAGCGLTSDGIVTQKLCNGAVDCTDDNLCTVDNCGSDQVCTFTPTPGVEPPNQIVGDCKKVRCNSGEQEAIADDSDSDDGNPCTKDACMGGKPLHDETVMEGQKCLLGSLAGECTKGECTVKCDANHTNCDDSNPCTEESCNVELGQCEFTPQHGKLVDDSSQSDCVEIRCVQDKAMTVPDDSEVPDDGFECTTDACSATSATHTPVAEGTPCGMGGQQKCSSDGNCVGCNFPQDCGVGDGCKTITCSAQHICGVDYAPVGTPLADPVPGDCLGLACADMGTIAVSWVDGDVPADNDGNDCTYPTCSSGTVITATYADTTACSLGQCLGGICVQCVNDWDCPLAGDKCTSNVCCTPITCASLGATCGSFGDGCGGMIDCNDGFQDGDESDVDCGGSCLAKCGQGQLCYSGNDCSTNGCADGYCCNTTCLTMCRACTSALTGQPNGTCAPILQFMEDDQPVPCGGAYSCNGAAACKLNNAQVCTMDTDCTSGQCSPEPGDPKVCCNVSCTAGCLSCLEKNTGVPDGSCAPILSGTDPDNECSGSGCCMGAGMCGGNTCP